MWYFRSCIGFVEASLQREPQQLRKDRNQLRHGASNFSVCGSAELIEPRCIGASPTNYRFERSR